MLGSHTSFMAPVAGAMGPGFISGSCGECRLPVALVEGGGQDAS